MLTANGNGHPPNPDRKRVAPERPEVKRFDRNALVKSELPKPANIAFRQDRPIDRLDLRTGSKRKIIEGSWLHHCD